MSCSLPNQRLANKLRHRVYPGGVRPLHYVLVYAFHCGLFFQFNDLSCKGLKTTGVNPVAYNIVDDFRIRKSILCRAKTIDT